MFDPTEIPKDDWGSLGNHHYDSDKTFINLLIKGDQLVIIRLTKM